MKSRLSTGIAELDQALGGGLLPGSLTMVVGATGIGKTQLGLQFSHAGRAAEGNVSAIVDLSSRGDSQNHAGYALRLGGDEMRVVEPGDPTACDPFSNQRPGDLLPFLGYSGRRVLRSQMDGDQWHAWQAELNRRLPLLYRFVYAHLVHGTRRFLVDGIEPQQSAADSLQLELLELIYHRMLRQDHDWLAREVLRERFREHESLVAERGYNCDESAAMVLVTTKHAMLDDLIVQPLDDGDLAAGANTVILMGRVRGASRLMRGLYIAKHRGSYADERVLPFEINDSGLQFSD